MEFMKKLFQPFLDELCVKMKLYQMVNDNEAIHVKLLEDIIKSCTDTPDMIITMLIRDGIIEEIKNNNEYVIIHKK